MTALTFDEAQDEFRAVQTFQGAGRYLATAMEYAADDMIGDDTFHNALAEVRDFLAPDHSKPATVETAGPSRQLLESAGFRVSETTNSDLPDYVCAHLAEFGPAAWVVWDPSDDEAGWKLCGDDLDSLVRETADAHDWKHWD